MVSSLSLSPSISSPFPLSSSSPLTLSLPLSLLLHRRTHSGRFRPHHPHRVRRHQRLEFSSTFSHDLFKARRTSPLALSLIASYLVHSSRTRFCSFCMYLSMHRFVLRGRKREELTKTESVVASSSTFVTFRFLRQSKEKRTVFREGYLVL